jgi:tRNA(fMet)-specific endonuclease VapC
MVCLDTSILVPLLRKEAEALCNLRHEADKGSRVSTTVISLCELYAGAYASQDPVKELRKVEELISRLEVLELTKEASQKYGELLNSSTIRAHPIGDFDLIIAAIALSTGDSLVSRNREHFGRVPGLVLEEW